MLKQNGHKPIDLWDSAATAKAPKSADFDRADDIAAATRNLERLDSERADNYQDWVSVGMALSELGTVGFALWQEWSQKSPKYKAGDCQEKRNTSY